MRLEQYRVNASQRAGRSLVKRPEVEPVPNTTRICPDCEQERPDFEFFRQGGRHLWPTPDGNCIACFLADRTQKPGTLPKRLKAVPIVRHMS